MFDGNFRTQRRAINLSGKRKTNTSKQAVLEQARIRREDRRRLVAQHDAATTLQCWFRGCVRRNQVAQQWMKELQHWFNTAVMNDRDKCVTCTLDAWIGLKTTTVAASQKNMDQILSLLHQYAMWLERMPKSLQKDPPTGHRIVLTCLQNLQTNESILKPHQTMTVLSYCLDVPLDEPTDTKRHIDRIKADSSYYSRRVGTNGFMMMVEIYCGARQLDDFQKLKSFLFKCIQFTTPDNVEGCALQAILVMTDESTAQPQTPELRRNNLLALLQILHSSPKESLSLLSGTVWKLASQHSMRILLSLVEQYRDSTDRNDIATMMQMLRMLLLENVGDFATPTQLQQRTCLLWTLNRAVRGDNLESTFSASIAAAAAAAQGELLEPESDDEDEDTRVHSMNVTLKTTKSPAYRVTKHELQTTAKLDRLFANHVKRANDSFTIVEGTSLLTKLTDSALWLQWCKVLFRSASDGGNVMEEDGESGSNLSSAVRQAQTDFVKVLAVMLQGTTGLRPGQNAASSVLLNRLAFSSDFLEAVWTLIDRDFGVEQTSRSDSTYFSVPSSPSSSVYYSFSLFCDLFAHNLIALRDNQFLLSHTRSERSTVPILAEQVISRLQIILYELYWTKPVRADDFKLILGDGLTLGPTGLVASTEDEQVAAFRARLLLTGTKLWNSLYERWCRLVRPTPFCDEANWWFPSMVSLSGDHVVASDDGISSNRRFELGPGSENLAMDVDSEHNSDSDMEDDNDDDHPPDHEADSLAEAFSDPKMARVLAAIPQALPFDRRVKLFDALLKAEKNRTQNEAIDMHEAMLAMMRGRESSFSGRERVEIHRDRLYDDSMRQLNQLGPKLKRRVQVSYINQYGAQEAGIDGGGVFKEFIDDLIRDAFTVEDSTATHQLFTATPLQTLTVNSELPPDTSLLVHYEFLGRVLGKAVYESILVEPQFCLPFLNQLLGKSNSMEDLKNYDPEYYRNLTKLLALSVNELASMGLTLEMTVGSGPNARTVELMPGSRNTTVTKQNVVQYIHLVSHQRMNVQSALQTRAFLNGFRDLIPASWVRLFSAYELQKLISGDDSVKGIDVGSLKQAMQYAGGYHPDQPLMQWFWEIVYDMDAAQQKKLLKFMTSCSRQPLLGFASLEPAPCIQQIRLPEALFQSDDKNEIVKRSPLPTSSTCMNLFKLPNYRDKELMRQKILAAIESGAGFELT